MDMTQEELDAAINSLVVKQMHSGAKYPAYDSLLVKLRDRSRILCSQINKAIPYDSTEYQIYLKERELNMRKLFGSVHGEVEIISPFTCDYGVFISLGNKVYMGAGCVVLDCGPVAIHDEVLIGPGVHIYTVNHPLDPEERRQGWELTKPVVIHQNAWIGGHVTICPGVTIGKNAVVGAGSVVTKDVPPYCVYAGNPAKLIKKIEH